MTETLFHAYLPLIVWTSLGLIMLRLVPETLPHWLGRGLYWVGIPLEILALARQTNFSEPAGLAPGITLAAIGTGVAIAYLCLVGLQQFADDQGAGDQCVVAKRLAIQILGNRVSAAMNAPCFQ